MDKKFPEGMVPIGKSEFKFSCHEGVACFTRCCKNVEMLLFPYDIVRLRTSLNIQSKEFLEKYTRIAAGDNPYFPTLMLKLDEATGSCPFLSESGCTVYNDRPSACRTYPLERAVDRNPEKGQESEFYFMTNHDYCFGHQEERVFTVKQWVRNQKLDQFNLMNDLWGELDTLFANNPWKGEGAAGEKQRLAFMVCFDIDGFREFVEKKELLNYFNLNKDMRRAIARDDEELLKFGFEWLKLLLSSKSSLVKK